MRYTIPTLWCHPSPLHGPHLPRGPRTHRPEQLLPSRDPSTKPDSPEGTSVPLTPPPENTTHLPAPSQQVILHFGDSWAPREPLGQQGNLLPLVGTQR